MLGAKWLADCSLSSFCCLLRIFPAFHLFERKTSVFCHFEEIIIHNGGAFRSRSDHRKHGRCVAGPPNLPYVAYINNVRVDRPQNVL